jgi:hypothetical protein
MITFVILLIVSEVREKGKVLEEDIKRAAIIQNTTPTQQ